MRRTPVRWGVALLIAAVVGWVTIGTERAAEGGQAEYSSAGTEARCFLWEVTGLEEEDGKLFLLGSIHLAPSSLFPLNHAIMSAFEESDGLVVEVNLLEATELELQAKLMERAMLTDGEMLKDRLSPEIYRDLAAGLLRRGLVPQAVQSFEPWFVALLIVVHDLEKNGYSAANGIDLYFLEKANGTKRIVALESVTYQIDLLDGLPDDLQELMLEDALRDSDEMANRLRRTTEAWERGDAGRLEDILWESPSDAASLQPLYEKILFERNRAMAGKLEPLLAGGKTWFVVVGAAHLVGEEGLVALLEKEGYTVRQVPKAR